MLNKLKTMITNKIDNAKQDVNRQIAMTLNIESNTIFIKLFCVALVAAILMIPVIYIATILASSNKILLLVILSLPVALLQVLYMISLGIRQGHVQSTRDKKMLADDIKNLKLQEMNDD